MNASGPIGGVLRFALPGFGIAGVGAGDPTTAFIMPVTRSVIKNLNTGVAIASLDSAVTLTLVLRRSNGELVASGQAASQLKANGHVARFMNEFFPNADIAEFEGTPTVMATEGTIVGTAIQLGSNAGEFTTLPVTTLR